MAISRKFIPNSGLDNNGNSITNAGTIGSSLQVSGANAITLTTTGATNVTLPTSGILATTDQIGNGSLTLSVSGVGLSGSGSFTANQLGSSSFTVTSNATSTNTPSTIVSRDASGNFNVGTITGALSGNASTATTLATARNINGVSFNGSADITVATAAGTLTGTTLASNVTASSLTSVGTLGSLTVTGDVTAATFTGALTGNASTATALQTARSISITGDATWTTSFNGTADATAALTLATVSTPGTYKSVTVNAKGLVTAGTNPTTLSGYGITDAVNTSTLGASNGVATLDATGKLTTAQIPASIAGGMNYQGTWNASTNTPTLASGSGTKGFFYKVSVAGSTNIDGITNWTVGDMISYNGTAWDQIQGGSSDVSSVFGRVGAVTLLSTDVTSALGFTPYDSTNPAGYTTNLGTVTAVTGTAPIVSSGGATPAISITPATTSAAGSMSAADKTKLDGIATGATANTGTVTSVSVTTANGVSGTVATNTTTPAITLTLGAITPTSVAATGAVTGSNLSGTNTGDNAANTLYANDYRVTNFVAGTDYLAPAGSAAALTNFPTLNQNTTGSAGSLSGANYQIASATLTTSATTANQVVDSVASTIYRTSLYVIQVTSGASYQYTEVKLIHDGASVYLVEIATMYTGSNLATFDADISSGNMRLLVTPVNAVTTVKVVRTSITI